MSITYPPELLPIPDPGDEVEILVSDGAGGWIVITPSQTEPIVNKPPFRKPAQF